MRVSASVDMKTPGLTRVQRALRDGKIERAVGSTAFDIQRSAQLLAPVDTGALKASIFAITSLTNDSAERLAEAQLPRKSKYQEGLKVAKVHSEWPRPIGRHEAVVAVGVEYGRPVNYRHKPYMTAAVWTNRRRLKERVREAMRGRSR